MVTLREKRVWGYFCYEKGSIQDSISFEEFYMSLALAEEILRSKAGAYVGASLLLHSIPQR